MDETRKEFLERTLSADGVIDVVGSAQNQAYVALELNFPNLEPNNGDQQKIAEIYALNTLYYALNGTEWKERSGWASAMDVCDGSWEGVVCNDEGVVSMLNLTDNDLMGTLPSEIKGLSGLGKLENRHVASALLNHSCAQRRWTFLLMG